MDQEEEIQIDISSMLIKGTSDRSNESGIQTSTSEQSSNAAKSPQKQSQSNNQSLSNSATAAGGALGQGSFEQSFLEEMKNEEALAPFLESETHRFSTKVQDLTEKDSEYLISVVKHFYDKICILQYEIQNTLEDQILSNVQLKISKFESKHGLKMKGMIPLHEDDQIKFNQKRYAYIVLDLQNSTSKFPSLTIA